MQSPHETLQTCHADITHIDGESDKVNVGVGGLNGSVETILLSLLQSGLTQVPEYLGSGQRLDLTLQVQLLTLLKYFDWNEIFSSETEIFSTD